MGRSRFSHWKGENCTMVKKVCINFCCYASNNIRYRQNCCGDCQQSIYDSSRNHPECHPGLTTLLFWSPFLVFLFFLASGILVGGLLFFLSHREANKKPYMEIPSYRFSKAPASVLNASSLSDIMQCIDLQDQVFENTISGRRRRMSPGVHSKSSFYGQAFYSRKPYAYKGI